MTTTVIPTGSKPILSDPTAIATRAATAIGELANALLTVLSQLENGDIPAALTQLRVLHSHSGNAVTALSCIATNPSTTRTITPHLQRTMANCLTAAIAGHNPEIG